MVTTDRTRLAGARLAHLPDATSWIAGFTVLVIATIWLSFLASGDGAFHVDIAITRFVQDHSSTATDAVADFGNAFGTAKVGVTLGIALALFLFSRGHSHGGAILLAATSFRLVNYGLKDLIDSPRPTPNLVLVKSNLDSNGFPSGHAQGATLLCGAALIASWPILTRGQRVAASVGASVLVLATAYARVSVGAHWPTDVLGGVLWGVILLTLVWFASRRMQSTGRVSAHPE
jgi:membrane-associated phospholipid phosphatase